MYLRVTRLFSWLFHFIRTAEVFFFSITDPGARSCRDWVVSSEGDLKETGSTLVLYHVDQPVIFYVNYEVSTAVTMKSSVLWDVTPYGPVKA
jgi:hypothetical protein